MKAKKWVLTFMFLVVAFLASNIGVTSSSFYDQESSTGNSFHAWIEAITSIKYAISYSNYTGSAYIGSLATVEIATNGQINDTVIDTLEFDPVAATTPNMIPIVGDVYAIAYAGDREDGFLKTIEISSEGQVTDVAIDTLEFDVSDGKDPNIIHISGNIYAIAYKGKGDDGFLITVEIATNGQINDTVIDTLEFDPVAATTPNMIPIVGDVYAIAYWGSGGDGFLSTVEIDSNGLITDTVIDTLVFDPVMGYYPNIIHISGDIYAIAYAGIFEYGYLKTVEIATNGQINDTVIDTLEFDGSLGTTPNIIYVSGDVYAIAYTGSSTNGFLKTVGIATNGQITDTVIDTLTFDSGTVEYPNIISIS